jgi:hypothetical protein
VLPSAAPPAEVSTAARSADVVHAGIPDGEVPAACAGEEVACGDEGDVEFAAPALAVGVVPAPPLPTAPQAATRNAAQPKPAAAIAARVPPADHIVITVLLSALSRWSGDAD